MVFGLIASGLTVGLIIVIVLLALAVREGNGLAASIGGLLMIAIVASGMIVGSWSTSDAFRSKLNIGEVVLILMAGLATILMISALLRRQSQAVWMVAATLASLMAIMAVSFRYGGDPVPYAVPVQSGFIAYGWWIFTRTRRPSRGRSQGHRRWRAALGILVAMSIINLASVVRTLFPDFGPLKSLVPMTISAGLLLLLFLLLWIMASRSAGMLGPLSAKESDSALAEHAGALIRAENLYRNSGLGIADVAQALAASPSSLSKSLADSDWGNFPALLQAIRLEEAKRMLGDPAGTRVSIEAIGLLCGFGARSTFYEVFQREIGMPPGEYRRKSCPDS